MLLCHSLLSPCPHPPPPSSLPCPAPRRCRADTQGDISQARGQLGQLLFEFSQIELNRDLLEAIKRTESKTGGYWCACLVGALWCCSAVGSCWELLPVASAAWCEARVWQDTSSPQLPASPGCFHPLWYRTLRRPPARARTPGPRCI